MICKAEILFRNLSKISSDSSFAAVPLGFLASKVPENLDAIIIGSGIGGLGLAVLLAKVGKKVLVLEQHDRAGGCCHTFTEKGFEFDVGEENGSRCSIPQSLFNSHQDTSVFPSPPNLTMQKCWWTNSDLYGNIAKQINPPAISLFYSKL